MLNLSSADETAWSRLFASLVVESDDGYGTPLQVVFCIAVKVRLQRVGNLIGPGVL